MPEFGIGVYRKHLVVYYQLDFALKVGIENIIEGVECLHQLTTNAASRGWLQKMRVIRVVRSSKALEIVLDCIQHDAQAV